MTTETTTEIEEPTAATEETQPATTEEPEAKPEVEATEEFADADRQKLTEVVRKERAAAKAARTAAEEAETRLAELEAAELRRGVAEEKGLNAEQAAFLTGETAEEMMASADALLAAFPPRTSDPLRRRPFERALRTGATGISEPAESMSTVADKVLD